MGAQLKKGILELVVLSKINDKDTYGYDIYQTVNRKMGISESTIYPILRKLTNEGYCETYLKASKQGPTRKYFKITKLGINKLNTLNDDWLRFEKVVNILIKPKKKR